MKDLIKALECCTNDNGGDCENCPYQSIENCQQYSGKMALEVIRKQSEGEWILECEPNGKPYCFHCSVCGVDMIKVATHFCPNCGAKMKGR